MLVARQESVSVLSYWAPSYTWELSAEQREARDWVGSQRGRATLTSSFPTLREEEELEVTWRLTNLTLARPQQASRVDLPSRSPQSVLVERLEFCWSGETVRLPARTCHTTIRISRFSSPGDSYIVSLRCSSSRLKVDLHQVEVGPEVQL